MKMLNALEDAKDAPPAALREAYSILLRTLYPAAPHICWQLWREMGFETAWGPIEDAPWPAVDEAALVQDEIELVLQISGKLRGSIRVPATADRAAVEAAALASPEFAKFAEGKPAKKVVWVPGRLVNVVV
jgi:leucyl-tRNA synthetase